MTDRTSKLLQWFLYLLLAVSAILTVLFYVDSGSNTDIYIYWSYALLGLTVVVTIVASLAGMLLNPKGAVKILILAGVMVVIGIVSYSMSGNEFSAIWLEKKDVTVATSRIVGAGLFFSYFLAALAVLAIVVASVSRIFK